MLDKLASVRGLNIPVLELMRDPDATFGQILKVGRRAIEQDGAEVLIFGCMTMSFLGVTPKLSAALGVPVVNAAQAALKAAESLVSINLSHSKKAFPPLPSSRSRVLPASKCERSRKDESHEAESLNSNSPGRGRSRRVASLPGQRGDVIRTLTILSRPQALQPQEFQSIQLLAQEWRKLGLDIQVQVMPWEQMSDLVWYQRDKWDMTAWQMVGRPERLDPDELVYNLFHTSTAEKGYNFVGYNNPTYDEIATAQRAETDIEKRRALVFKAQEMIAADQPIINLVHPKVSYAFNKSVWKESSVVEQAGIGIRNFWTSIGHRAGRRQEGHHSQFRRQRQCDQPALHLRRPRQLDLRAGLGPAAARRPRRSAEAVGGRSRTTGSNDTTIDVTHRARAEVA